MEQTLTFFIGFVVVVGLFVLVSWMSRHDVSLKSPDQCSCGMSAVWICLMSLDYQTAKCFGKDTISVTRVLPAVSHEETLGVSL